VRRAEGNEAMLIAPIGDLWPLAMMLGGLLAARFAAEQHKSAFPSGVYVLKGACGAGRQQGKKAKGSSSSSRGDGGDALKTNEAKRTQRKEPGAKGRRCNKREGGDYKIT